MLTRVSLLIQIAKKSFMLMVPITFFGAIRNKKQNLEWATKAFPFSNFIPYQVIQ